MSDRDILNLDDGASLDGAPANDGQWDDDLLGGFPDDDPAAEDSARPPADTARGQVKKKQKKQKKQEPTPVAAARIEPPRGPKVRPRRRSPQRGAGVLCFLLVVLAGLTMSTGLLTAIGATPEVLLDFSGFNDPATIGDFQAHPVNAFWLATLVTLVAAMLAAVAVERRIGSLDGTAADSAQKLSAIARLDPEQPATWQDPSLQSDPDLAASISSLLGHYNLQQAKLMRYVDLEGELHRLEKAFAESDLDQLAGQWENPSAGSLADQMVRVIDDRQAEHRDREQHLRRFEDQGADLVTGLRDARGWNATTLDQISQQGAAAERVARQVGKLAHAVADTQQQQAQIDRLRQALQSVQEELATLPARGAERRRDPEAPLMTLVERASRLAFQIAMEVARLGAKGERLLPLTQDLEELTTELRHQTDQGGREGKENPVERALDAVRGRLAELDPSVLADGGRTALATAVTEVAPLASQAAEALAQVVRGFNVQTARLSQLLGTAVDLTGIDINVEDESTSGDGDGLAVEQFDPFGSESAPGSGLVADPFASSGGSIFDTSTVPGLDREFSQTALPGTNDVPAPPPLPEATSLPEAAPLPVTGLGVPQEAEKVYDLTEFDATRLLPEPTAEPAPAVHDLSEFGAVKIS